MWYSKEVTRKPQAVYRLTCPVCGQEANMLLTKEERSGCIWIIPWWGSDYFFTCGNCFATFKIAKEFGKQLESGKRDTR